MKFKLMIKTHNQTGLKYLCVTGKDDFEKYKGSGLYWKRHLEKYGDDIKTELLFETGCKDELYRAALDYSSKFDVVESDEWANLIPETGYDYDRITRNGWFGWYNSLSDEERKSRNHNISEKVKERYEKMSKTELSNILSNRRLNLSEEKKRSRKKKIQKVYETGKHDELFKRYSVERTGKNNPNSKPIEIEGIKYDCIADAVRQTGHTRSVIQRRLNSDMSRWSEWKRL